MLAIAKSVHDWQIRQKRKADDMNAPVPEEFVAHVPVPTKDQLEKMILDKRKEVYFSRPFFVFGLSLITMRRS